MSIVLKVTKANTLSLEDASPAPLTTRTPLKVTEGSASSVTCSEDGERQQE
jgi:hypothetical protein